MAKIDKALLQAAWGIIKPKVQVWVTTRALRIPTAKRAALCKKAGVTMEQLLTLQEAFQDCAVSSLDSIVL